jgi:preprotein translocase subunit YajC
MPEFVTGVDGDKFWLEIDDDVQIRISRAAVASRVNDGGDSPASAPDTAPKRDKGTTDDSDES